MAAAMISKPLVSSLGRAPKHWILHLHHTFSVCMLFVLSLKPKLRYEDYFSQMVKTPSKATDGIIHLFSWADK